MKINYKTEKYALIGYPLSKTLSPFIHNTFYEKNNLNNIYLTFEIESNLDKHIDAMKVLGVKGFNVTVPYKKEVIKYLDGLDSSAEKIGAVNTVKVLDNKLIGFNTDGLGFMKSLERKDIRLKNKNILVIGAGGASNSICTSILENEINRLYIANRNEDNLNSLINKLEGNFISKEILPLSLDLRGLDKSSIDIIINTSSVGMYPNNGISPIDLNGFKDVFLYDIIYKPLETKFLKEGRMKGFKCLNGLEMLLYQALESQEIWLDELVSLEVERELLEDLYSHIEGK